MVSVRADICVIGCGAAGLFAGIWAGRALRDANVRASVVGVDGARKLGAKILVAGGGRCNVTHHAVDETAYAGSSRNAIKNVLRRFGVSETVAFFNELGVEFKREETGKLFPTTDSASTVLHALHRAASEAGFRLMHPWRVESVERVESDGASGFRIRRSKDPAWATDETIRETEVVAKRVVLATGGMALPRTGSDGHGYAIAKALGHTVTERVFPALVPLTLGEKSQFIKDLSGLTVPATIELWSGTGKKLQAFTNSTLCTHFGLSGPSVLDISRYYTDAKRSDAGAKLTINWTPGKTFEQMDAGLAENPKISVGRRLAEIVPERLARALCESVRIDPGLMVSNLKREDRRTLAHQVTRTEVQVTGDRGYTHAEVTAGGVPLSEVQLATMESRVCPGLYLCGEICDVDGRIGGFNFQWAWASGFIAGSSAGTAAGKAIAEGMRTEVGTSGDGSDPSST